MEMKVYVFGLGHIGLPTALWICLKGYEVVGIDINPKVVEEIENGSIPIHEYYEGIHISKLAQDLMKQKRMTVRKAYERIGDEPSIFVISVGIADQEDGFHDISPIENVVDTILPTLVHGDLLLLKTTMIPGTIDSLVIQKIKDLGKEVYVAYSPETISETFAFEELRSNPRILSAMDDKSYHVAEAFLKSLSDSAIHKASSIRMAETVKVIQNIDRDVNIALVNEISEVMGKLGLDVYELCNLVNTHPRVKLLQPGPGVGGYCLPNALKYLKGAFGKEENIPLSLMETARRLNERRPRKIVEMVEKALRDAGKNIKEAKIAVIGLAMKDYCADYRYSPALDIISLLMERGAEVRAYDPLIPFIVDCQKSSYVEAIANADCMVVAAKQKDVVFDINEICSVMAQPVIVIDTRNTVPHNHRIQLFKS
ncbi:nucleotide sugar dehydrogenase [Thermotalea metallivorans]|uniref:UDP-N-acetyl-D-glucosamine 6-dehydrogenase n=1 Tax=Thermotalea metallivorans TaxID=520762 RepID=A0A140L2B9_9FIRM|nr:nucleotide sugar dehydrogenase [Thermotalea metallivorans]KXG74694.1 UDP-N-acetyl-D-glucosamine 6-dehydrogenase [Thermotalea metallivorans]